VDKNKIVTVWGGGHMNTAKYLWEDFTSEEKKGGEMTRSPPHSSRLQNRRCKSWLLVTGMSFTGTVHNKILHHCS
jgi:hypothetical protein